MNSLAVVECVVVGVAPLCLWEVGKDSMAPLQTVSSATNILCLTCSISAGTSSRGLSCKSAAPLLRLGGSLVGSEESDTEESAVVVS